MHTLRRKLVCQGQDECTQRVLGHGKGLQPRVGLDARRCAGI